MLWTLAAVFAVLPGALGAQLKLHHRVFHPSIPDPQWAPRGTLSLGTAPPAIADAPEYRADLAAFAGAIREALGVHEDVFEVFYQVALERPSDASPRDYDVSSVRAVRPCAGMPARAGADAARQCHLDHATSELFVVHLSAEGAPHALDYFVAPIPTDGRCPPAFAPGADPALAATFNIRERTNTTVRTTRPTPPIK
jgi:hypothetical protein